MLEWINEVGKFAGYNIQKSTIFLYTKNELSEKQIKEMIPFTIASGIK